MQNNAPGYGHFFHAPFTFHAVPDVVYSVNNALNDVGRGRILHWSRLAGRSLGEFRVSDIDGLPPVTAVKLVRIWK